MYEEIMYKLKKRIHIPMMINQQNYSQQNKNKKEKQ